MIDQPNVRDLMAPGVIASLQHLSYESDTDDYAEEFSDSSHTYSYYVEDFERELFDCHHASNQFRLLVREIFVELTPQFAIDDAVGAIPQSIQPQNLPAFERALDTLYVGIDGGSRIKMFERIQLVPGKFVVRFTENFFTVVRSPAKNGKCHAIPSYDLDFDLTVRNVMSVWSYVEKRRWENCRKATADKLTLKKLLKVCPDLRSVDLIELTDEMLDESLVKVLDHLQTHGVGYTPEWRAHIRKSNETPSISVTNLNKVNICFAWGFEAETKFSAQHSNASDSQSIEIELMEDKNDIKK